VQANCPQCSQKIVIDDARVPERAFSVKCPKCQNTVKFPGRGAAAGAPAIPPMPEPPAPETAPGAPPAAAGAPGSDDMRLQLMAQLRREMAMPAADAGSAGRALVALPDRGLAGGVTVMLTRLGYVVDTIDDSDEASRLIEQGVYSVAVMARVAPTPGKETLYQRIGRMSPDYRRRLFIVLVGDEWKTGDGLQAWSALSDLVLNTRDAVSADVVLRQTYQERARIYQVYVDARARFEAASAI
jgi:predicted Zn finger-like uncharacterized protein